MSQEKSRDFFCSQLSLNADEQLFGTASKTDVWFLLEYTEVWAAKAFEGSNLPESVKEKFSSCINSIPDSRIQFIKQSPRSAVPITFYVGVSRELSPILYKFQLDKYEDLLTLNIPAILRGDPRYARSASMRPVFLVCTNGNRDKCCAKFGLEVYREMTKQAGDSVWQCTHMGGHRFAANVLYFPHGICYGRVRGEEVSDLMEEHRREQISLEKYRGRSCYAPHVQAAEYFLRAETGVRAISGFRLLEFKAKDIAENNWAVTFTEVSNGKTHSVHVAIERSAFKNYVSCGDGKRSGIDRYHLVRHNVLDPVVIKPET